LKFRIINQSTVHLIKVKVVQIVFFELFRLLSCPRVHHNTSLFLACIFIILQNDRPIVLNTRLVAATAKVPLHWVLLEVNTASTFFALASIDLLVVFFRLSNEVL